MTGARIEIESVDFLQFPDSRERIGAEGGLTIECVEHDSFQLIAEGEVVVFGERLENL
jgi:hypothetical protein